MLKSSDQCNITFSKERDFKEEPFCESSLTNSVFKLNDLNQFPNSPKKKLINVDDSYSFTYTATPRGLCNIPKHNNTQKSLRALRNHKPKSGKAIGPNRILPKKSELNYNPKFLTGNKFKRFKQKKLSNKKFRVKKISNKQQRLIGSDIQNTKSQKLFNSEQKMMFRSDYVSKSDHKKIAMRSKSKGISGQWNPETEDVPLSARNKFKELSDKMEEALYEATNQDNSRFLTKSRSRLENLSNIKKIIEKSQQEIYRNSSKILLSS